MVRSHVLRTGVALALALGGLTAFGPSIAPAHAASHPFARHHPVRGHHPFQYQGYLTAAPVTTTAPVSLTIQTPYNGQVGVSVTPSTRIIRLYGGPSGLDELSANDVLQVRGATTAPGQVTATWIRDLSIHARYGRLIGLVTGVTSSTVSVVAQRDPHTPFVSGENVTIPVGASTEVISGTSVITGSTADISTGNRIVALGVYNNNSRTFQSTFRIRVLGTVVRPHRAAYTGYLTAAPVTTTAPVSLTIQTPHNGQVTVAVTPSTKIVRRYNGASSLDELSANDVLQVRGVTSAAGTITATWMRDVSIQAAYTRLVGQVTAVTPNSVSVVVQRDETGRSPFIVGQNVTLPVGASTQVISGTTTTTGSTGGIAPGNRIVALGVYNRIGNTFQSTFRIRVLPH